MEKTPQEVAGVARLKRWALSPAGRAAIGLNGPKAWDACHLFYKDKIPARMVDGWCARLIHDATGRWPGRHGDGHKG